MTGLGDRPEKPAAAPVWAEPAAKQVKYLESSKDKSRRRNFLRLLLTENGSQ